MRLRALTLFFFFITLVVQGQKESANWYFSRFAGITFNTLSGGLPTFLPGGQISGFFQEGVAIQSDTGGNLLFYTDGRTVWDATHTIMPGGTGLGGGESSSQSVIIVPHPGDTNQYYVFTTDANGGPNGLQYNIVDLSVGASGTVILSNQSVLGIAAEKLTAVKHCNNQDYWLAAHGYLNDSFYIYSITNTGLIMTPLKVNIGDVYISGDEVGGMKFSASGSKLAAALGNGRINVFDFNISSGVLSNPLTIQTSRPLAMVEFSPDESVLYVTTWGMSTIFQYDLSVWTSVAITNSQYIISAADSMYTIQRGLDDRLYVGSIAHQFLAAIHNPNKLGLASNYEDSVVYLGGALSTHGLPTFVSSIFLPSKASPIQIDSSTFCFGENVPFMYFGNDSIIWDFGDLATGTLNMSTLDSATHLFSDSGNYLVTAIIMNGCGNDTFLTNVTITKNGGQIISNDTLICPGSPVLLSVNGGSNHQWQPATGLNNPGVSSPIASPTINTVYTMQSENNCGSIDIDSISIMISEQSALFLPNAVSPNNDGINDVFLARVDQYDAFLLKIYNRWGRLIFESDNPNIGWDGQFNNNNVMNSVFVYTIEVSGSCGSIDKKGNLSLIR